MESCHEKIDENNTLIKAQDIKIQECLDRIEKLTTKCANLTKENEELRQVIDKQDQYTRLNCVEIHGVSEIKNESILTTVAMVHRALGVGYDKNQLDACHRLKGNPKQDQPQPIIVKYVSRFLKDEIMAARKVKRTLCLRDLDLVGETVGVEASTPIYINESLTRQNKMLLSKCREYARKEKIKFVWVKNGKIFMRKTEGSMIVLINSENKFRDIH